MGRAVITRGCWDASARCHGVAATSAAARRLLGAQVERKVTIYDVDQDLKSEVDPIGRTVGVGPGTFAATYITQPLYCVSLYGFSDGL